MFVAREILEIPSVKFSLKHPVPRPAGLPGMPRLAIICFAMSQQSQVGFKRAKLVQSIDII